MFFNKIKLLAKNPNKVHLHNDESETDEDENEIKKRVLGGSIIPLIVSLVKDEIVQAHDDKINKTIERNNNLAVAVKYFSEAKD